jgi:hypothetical protein
LPSINRDKRSEFQIRRSVAFGDFLSGRPLVQAADFGVMLGWGSASASADNAGRKYSTLYAIYMKTGLWKARVNDCPIPHLRYFLYAVAVPEPANVDEIGCHQIKFPLHLPRSWHEGCICECQRNVVFPEQVSEPLIESTTNRQVGKSFTRFRKNRKRRENSSACISYLLNRGNCKSRGPNFSCSKFIRWVQVGLAAIDSCVAHSRYERQRTGAQGRRPDHGANRRSRY